MFSPHVWPARIRSNLNYADGKLPHAGTGPLTTHSSAGMEISLECLGSLSHCVSIENIEGPAGVLFPPATLHRTPVTMLREPLFFWVICKLTATSDIW